MNTSDADGKKPSTPSKTLDEEHRKYIDEQLRLTKNGIELCIKRYMTKQEAMDFLSRVKNIKPNVTELVWGRLVKDNPDFFKAFYAKMILKDQILEFNRLLLKQAELIKSSASLNSPQQHHIITAESMVRDDMQQINVFHSYGSSVQGTLNQYAHNRGIGDSQNLLLNAGLAQVNHHEQAGCSSLFFSPPVSFLESRRVIADASLVPFTSIESNGKHLDDMILPEWNSCFLEQFQQSPDPEFAAEFATNPELLGCYPMPPPPPPLIRDANNVVVPNGHVGILDTPSESLHYPFLGDQIE